MNIAPHTHKFAIRANPYGITFMKGLIIEYGDQTSKVWCVFPGWKGRLQRKTLRVVAKHDKASRVAYKSPEAVAEVLKKERNEVVGIKDCYGSFTERNDAWGEDLLKAPPVVKEPEVLGQIPAGKGKIATIIKV